MRSRKKEALQLHLSEYHTEQRMHAALLKFTAQWAQGKVGKMAIAQEVICCIIVVFGLIGVLSFTVGGIIMGLLSMFVGVIGFKGAWDRNNERLTQFAIVMLVMVFLAVVFMIIGLASCGKVCATGAIVGLAIWNILCYGACAYLSLSIKEGGGKLSLKSLKTGGGAAVTSAKA